MTQEELMQEMSAIVVGSDGKLTKENYNTVAENIAAMKVIPVGDRLQTLEQLDKVFTLGILFEIRDLLKAKL